MRVFRNATPSQSSGKYTRRRQAINLKLLCAFLSCQSGVPLGWRAVEPRQDCRGQTRQPTPHGVPPCARAGHYAHVS